MNPKHFTTLSQVAEFVNGSKHLSPERLAQSQRYQLIEATLRHFHYNRLSKPDKGLIIAYLRRLTGYSRQQLTRFLARRRKTGRLRWDVQPVCGISARFTAADIRLLATIDALHDTPSGPAALW